MLRDMLIPVRSGVGLSLFTVFPLDRVVLGSALRSKGQLCVYNLLTTIRPCGREAKRRKVKKEVGEKTMKGENRLFFASITMQR